MILLSVILLTAFTIWAVVWSTDKSGASIPYIGRFGDSKKWRYYLTGILFYWPTMMVVQFLFLERYYRRGYGILHLVSLLILATGWNLVELCGLRTTVLAIVSWGLFGQIVMFFRYGNVCVIAQAVCFGLAIASMIMGCSIVWWYITLIVLFVSPWISKLILFLERCHIELGERRAYI